MSDDTRLIEKAARILAEAENCYVFTGSGISVESGIPSFRGPEGLWSQYDPKVLDLSFFKMNPLESWQAIKEIFYNFMGKARPNPAHTVLAKLEDAGIVKGIITQNIDNLHHLAGSKNVVEFHGNSRKLVCLSCGAYYDASEEMFQSLPPRCNCSGILKPDFVFFSESIPPDALARSEEITRIADVIVVMGTTGEVYPAASIPQMASSNGAIIIEINIEKSNFTGIITDLFIKRKASEVMEDILKLLDIERPNV